MQQAIESQLRQLSFARRGLLSSPEMEKWVCLQEERWMSSIKPLMNDFTFFESQVRDLNAERNQSLINSIFRTLTGTRCKIRRRQVTSIPPTPITLGAASPQSSQGWQQTKECLWPMQTKVGKLQQQPSMPHNGRTGIVSSASDDSQ